LAEADPDAVERLLSDVFAAGAFEFAAAHEGASAFDSALAFGFALRSTFACWRAIEANQREDLPTKPK